MHKVDVKKQMDKLKKKRQMYVALLVICGLACLSVTVLLLLISPFQNYTWYLIANVAITVAYGSFAVYVFTNPLKDLTLHLRWLNRVTTSKEEKEYLRFEKRQKHNYDGIEVDLLTFVTLEGVSRDIYCLSDQAEDLTFGVIYSVCTCANTLTSYEVKYEQ